MGKPQDYLHSIIVRIFSKTFAHISSSYQMQEVLAQVVPYWRTLIKSETHLRFQSVALDVNKMLEFDFLYTSWVLTI